MLYCEHCGAEFEPKKKNQRFCRPKCRNSARSKRHYQKEYQTEWRRRNRESVNAKAIVRDEAKPEQALIRTTKSRAKKLGIEFNITKEDIAIPNECPVFGVPFEKRTRYAASIDRIDSSLGYIKGNIQIISRLANTMKNDSSHQELREFAEWAIKQSTP